MSDDKEVSDLGDDEIKEITRILDADEGDQHAVALRLALARAIPELRGHRAAKAADAERIKAVVLEAFAWGRHQPSGFTEHMIAARVAERLATARPRGRVIADHIPGWLADLDSIERSVTGAVASGVLRQFDYEAP